MWCFGWFSWQNTTSMGKCGRPQAIPAAGWKWLNPYLSLNNGIDQIGCVSDRAPRDHCPMLRYGCRFTPRFHRVWGLVRKVTVWVWFLRRRNMGLCNRKVYVCNAGWSIEDANVSTVLPPNVCLSYFVWSSQGWLDALDWNNEPWTQVVLLTAFHPWFRWMLISIISSTCLLTFALILSFWIMLWTLLAFLSKACNVPTKIAPKSYWFPVLDCEPSWIHCSDPAPRKGAVCPNHISETGYLYLRNFHQTK